MNAATDKTMENPTSWVMEAIIREILLGTFHPGSKLKEAELTSRFNVGRSVVREALRRLEERGIATATSGAGMRVRSISRRDFEECAVARLALEMRTAADAAEKANAAAIEEIEKVLTMQSTNVAKMGNTMGFAVAATDKNFHRAIAIAGGNGFVLRMLESNVLFVNRLFQIEHPGLSGRADLALEEHQEICRAIRLRDPEVAALMMRRHLTRSTAWYLEQLDAATVKRQAPRRRRQKNVTGETE